jgi:type I restriction enzyme, R subunit
MDDTGQTVPGSETVIEAEVDEEDEAEEGRDGAPMGFGGIPDDDDAPPRKFYFDGGVCEVIGEVVYELDPNGNRLRTFRLTDYTGEQVRTLYRSALEVRRRWTNPEQRSEIIDQLADRGIDFGDLKAVMNLPEADPFDLLCHLAFDTPVQTFRQRAETLRRDRQDFFSRYGQDAQEILQVLLDTYAEGGPDQLILPAALKLKAMEKYGNVGEIAAKFGDADALKQAIDELQALLYSA